MAPTSSPAPTALGIDIGGTGIKGARVNLTTGTMVTDRVRITTPQPAAPDPVAGVVRDIVDQIEEKGRRHPLGVTFPAVIQHGVARSAANVDRSWIGTDAQQLLADATGHDTLVVNDADAAGFAETRFGAARGHHGVVFVATLGTGVGTALIVNDRLMPNTELGHIELDGVDAETVTAESARGREKLSWEEWAERLQRYFSAIEDLLWPDLIVVGGGVSKKHGKFLPLLHLRAPIVPAELRNNAGIVGAAVLAAERYGD